jgi:hypothetical protein
MIGGEAWDFLKNGERRGSCGLIQRKEVAAAIP